MGLLIFDSISGADVNRLSQNEDHTPLSLACSGDHKNVVELLLEHGADPSIRLKDGSNALIEATKAGNTQIVRLLLEYSPSNTDAMVDPQELMNGDLQPRVPTQALPNMVPPAQQSAVGLATPRRNLNTAVTAGGNMTMCQGGPHCIHHQTTQFQQHQQQLPIVPPPMQQPQTVPSPQVSDTDLYSNRIIHIRLTQDFLHQIF